MDNKFSLLQQLNAATDNSVEQTATKVKTVAEQTKDKQYRLYVLESEESGSCRIAVPVDNVEAFDLFLDNNPDKFDTIAEHLEPFAAMLVKL